MSTLYLCGAGNAEGIRLAIVVNQAQKRWDRIVILDDDASKHGRLILGLQIAGPFSMLAKADPATSEVSNMVTRTTNRREAAMRKIQAYNLPFATLIDPGVDMSGVEFRGDLTVYQNVSFCAGAFVDAGSVVLTGAVVGHGCRMGRCCVVAPGGVINARVELGDGVYLGTNASILPDLKVGPWATIGANSAVVQNVPAGATVMGVPAQVLIPGNGMGKLEDEGVQPAVQPVEKPTRTDDLKEIPAPAPPSSPALAKLELAQQRFIREQLLGKDNRMSTSEFLGALEEALEVPPGTIHVDDLLTDTGCWDSMAVLTFTLLADQKLQVTVSGGQLQECKSVRDLVGLLGDKLAD
jgi:serine acetyltransferase/acyl carrier protein